MNFFHFCIFFPSTWCRTSGVCYLILGELIFFFMSENSFDLSKRRRGNETFTLFVIRCILQLHFTWNKCTDGAFGATTQTERWIKKNIQNVDNKIAIVILPSNDSINSIFIASGQWVGVSNSQNGQQNSLNIQKH